MPGIFEKAVGKNVIGHHDSPFRHVEPVEEPNVVFLLAIDENEIEFARKFRQNSSGVPQQKFRLRVEIQPVHGLARFRLPRRFDLNGD
jgi:hypothetical protein